MTDHPAEAPEPDPAAIRALLDQAGALLIAVRTVPEAHIDDFGALIEMVTRLSEALAAQAERLARAEEERDAAREQFIASEWSRGADKLREQSLKTEIERLQADLEAAGAGYADLVLRTDAVVTDLRAGLGAGGAEAEALRKERNDAYEIILMTLANLMPHGPLTDEERALFERVRVAVHAYQEAGAFRRFDAALAPPGEARRPGEEAGDHQRPWSDAQRPWRHSPHEEH